MQNISQGFTDAINSSVHMPVCIIKICWDLSQFDPSASFAMIDSSQIDGPDVLQGEGSAITRWQQYVYDDESIYLKSWEYTKEADYPMMGVVKSRATIVLDNTTKRYLPTNPVNNIKNGRLIQIFDGYNKYTVPQFIGITDKPEQDIKVMETKIDAYDAMQYLENFELEGALYENQSRSDIIESILNEAGLGSSQYIIENSSGDCKLAYVKQGEKALEVIREICQAEDARFYIDELGYFNFENRHHLAKAPHNVAVATLAYDTNILTVSLDKDTIINKGVAKITPLVWADSDEVYKLSDQTEPIVIPANGTYDMKAEFSGPVKDLIQPTAGGLQSNYTASNIPKDGIDKTAKLGITAWSDNGTEALITLSNSDSAPIYLTSLVIHGIPVKDAPVIEYETPDSLAQDSIDEYGIQKFEISNNRFLNTIIEMRSIMDGIVIANQNGLNTIDLDSIAIPNLQIGDRLDLIESTTGRTLSVVIFKIIKSGEGLKYKLTVREKISQYTAGINYASIDSSQIDGPDKLGR